MISFDDEQHMRRYAFEAMFAHALWFLVIFAFTGGFSVSFSEWLDAFYQWDARWYGTIAMDGHGFMPQTYVFPPLHGWLLGAFTNPLFALANFLSLHIRWIEIFNVVAFTIGISTYAMANTIFVWMTEKRWQIERKRLWLIAVANPMGYFALSAYSDTLFFLLFTVALLLIVWTGPRRETWSLRSLNQREQLIARTSLSLILFSSPWVRLTGFAFAAWIVLKRKEVLATFAALAAFLSYYAVRTGNPFYFLRLQIVFQMPEGGFITGLHNSVAILLEAFKPNVPFGTDFFLYTLDFAMLPLLALSASLSLCIWFLKKREYELAIAIFALIAISHNQAFWRSTVRYALPIYPLLWIPALRPRSPRVTMAGRKYMGQIAFAIALGFAITVQVFYARLFRSGGWAF